ncbi:hypothetical protein HEK131_44970 [Streptomyces seoulensis]|nr:hypothetical protein HEK131_44970 [Streptomyces seoulensis]
MSEKVKAVTLIKDPAIASKTALAADGPPPNKYSASEGRMSRKIRLSNRGRPTPAATASRTPRAGSGHSCARSASRIDGRRTTTLLAGSSSDAAQPNPEIWQHPKTMRT